MLAAVDAGTPREEQVAKTFSVSVPTMKRRLKRRREKTGDVEPRAIPGRPPRKGEMLEEWLPKHLEAKTTTPPSRSTARRSRRSSGRGSRPPPSGGP